MDSRNLASGYFDIKRHLPSILYLQELMHSVDGLKLGVQELQRDLTLRRCLAKEAAINTLDDKISGVEELLSKHLIVVEQKQPDLEKVCLFLFCCFTPQVNSYGHGGTVSSPKYTFFLGKLEQAVNQNFVHILSLVSDNNPS